MLFTENTEILKIQEGCVSYVIALGRFRCDADPERITSVCGGGGRTERRTRLSKRKREKVFHFAIKEETGEHCPDFTKITD